MDSSMGRVFRTSELLGRLTEIEAKKAPERLYIEGNRTLLEDGQRIAVIGSRKASPQSIDRARSFTKAVVDHGITVVSGLAEGIDTVAHETAIEMGGNTIAVLGTPLSKAYPRRNKDLLDKIMRDHLAISEFPEGHPLKRGNFPRRNRTMALISDATVIVEASEKSGTRHQGWEAIRIGRFLYIMQNVVQNDNLGWPQEMIKYGAQELRPEDLPHILSDIPCFTAGGVNEK